VGQRTVGVALRRDEVQTGILHEMQSNVYTGMHASGSMGVLEEIKDGKEDGQLKDSTALFEWVGNHLADRGTNTATRTMKGTYVMNETTAITRHRMRHDFASNSTCGSSSTTSCPFLCPVFSGPSSPILLVSGTPTKLAIHQIGNKINPRKNAHA